MLRSDVTRFLTTILIGTTYLPSYDWLLLFPVFLSSLKIISYCGFYHVLSVANIGATALVTDAATAIFGEAGVSAATGVMTVCTSLSMLCFCICVLIRVKLYMNPR